MRERGTLFLRELADAAENVYLSKPIHELVFCLCVCVVCVFVHDVCVYFCLFSNCRKDGISAFTIWCVLYVLEELFTDYCNRVFRIACQSKLSVYNSDL